MLRLVQLLPCMAIAASGCGNGSDIALSEFELRFAAIAASKTVGCADTIPVPVPDGQATIGISDLRFYVSNLRFWDVDGTRVEVHLDDNEFQYRNDAGQVALIDLTSNTEGSCSGSAISFAEGTARTNDSITGMTAVDDVAGIAFDIGVPQQLMKHVIAHNTAEATPSPLNEMYWSWVTGYRHFVLNFAVEMDGDAGDGYVHIGSRDCGPMGGLALEDRDQCGFINTPTVSLPAFDLRNSGIAVDLLAILKDLDFRTPIYDPDTFETIGEGVGVECHSSPMQADCGQILTSFGVDASTGAASAEINAVFSAMQ